MRPIDQTLLYERDGRGDCCRAAVASLLELSLGETPDFCGESGADQREMLEEWLFARGFELLRLPPSYVPDIEYLATGRSLRGVMHMVVYRAGRLLHDPHPSRAGLMTVMEVLLVVPHRPGLAFRREAA